MATLRSCGVRQYTESQPTLRILVLLLVSMSWKMMKYTHCMLQYETFATAITPYRCHLPSVYGAVLRQTYEITFHVIARRTNGPR